MVTWKLLKKMKNDFYGKCPGLFFCIFRLLISLGRTCSQPGGLGIGKVLRCVPLAPAHHTLSCFCPLPSFFAFPPPLSPSLLCDCFAFLPSGKWEVPFLTYGLSVNENLEHLSHTCRTITEIIISKEPLHQGAHTHCDEGLRGDRSTLSHSPRVRAQIIYPKLLILSFSTGVQWKTEWWRPWVWSVSDRRKMKKACSWRRLMLPSGTRPEEYHCALPLCSFQPSRDPGTFLSLATLLNGVQWSFAEGTSVSGAPSFCYQCGCTDKISIGISNTQPQEPCNYLMILFNDRARFKAYWG